MKQIDELAAGASTGEPAVAQPTVPPGRKEQSAERRHAALERAASSSKRAKAKLAAEGGSAERDGAGAGGEAAALAYADHVRGLTSVIRRLETCVGIHSAPEAAAGSQDTLTSESGEAMLARLEGLVVRVEAAIA